MRPPRPLLAALPLAITTSLAACGGPPASGTDPGGVAVAHAAPGAGWAELPLRGRVGEGIGLSPDGRLWITTTQGEIFAADSVNGDWREVTGPRFRDENDTSFAWTFYPDIDRVTWLNARTAIASGYVGRGESQAHDAVLRTVDGGVTWDTVTTGADQWNYDLFVDRDGGLWTGGSAGTLVFSGDGGKTWQRRSRPFGGSRLRAIWIEDGRRGVAAAVGNRLVETADGGRTWTPLPTPLDQQAFEPDGDEYDDHRFEAVAQLGETLWAVQENRVFTSPRSPVRWRQVGPERLVVMTVDRAACAVYALGESLHVYRLGNGGAARRITDAPLYAGARQLTAHAGVVYVADQNDGLYRISPGRTVYSRPLTRGTVRPRVVRVAPGAGRTWAATEHGLYSAAPGGRGWALAATSPRPIAGMVALDGGRVMLWDGHGANAVFDPRTGRMGEIAGLHGDDVVKVIAGDSVWLAYGGRQYESAMRVDVARTFVGGEFAGSRPNGFIYRSRDRGRGWTRIAEWPEHGVAAVFPHPDGALTLFSYLGSVMRLAPAGDGYRATPLVTATEANDRSVPYAQVVGALYFNGAEGWMDGWIHHLRNVRWETHDGGRSWSKTPPRDRHFRALFPAGGRWIASTGHRLFVLDGDGAAEIYDGGGREARFDAEGDETTIRDAAAGPDGTITILRPDGSTVRVYPRSAR